MRLTKAQLRSLLHEAVTELPTKIQVGSKFEDIDGNQMTVTDIYVDVGYTATLHNVWIEYDYETVGGRRGSERNTIQNFLQNLGVA